MSEIKVPDGMLKAALEALRVKWGYSPDYWQAEGHETSTRIALEAALRWLSENPIVPTDEQARKLILEFHAGDHFFTLAQGCIREWQRRMFLAPDEDEEIRDLLTDSQAHIALNSDYLNASVREAFRRGRAK